MKNQEINGVGFPKVENLVMRDRNLCLGEKAVYAYLCTCAGMWSTICVQIREIREDLHIGTRALNRKLKNLESEGYLTVEPIGKKYFKVHLKKSERI